VGSIAVAARLRFGCDPLYGIVTPDPRLYGFVMGVVTALYGTGWYCSHMPLDSPRRTERAPIIGRGIQTERNAGLGLTIPERIR